jgi:hypothetical protein
MAKTVKRKKPVKRRKKPVTVKPKQKRKQKQDPFVFWVPPLKRRRPRRKVMVKESPESIQSPLLQYLRADTKRLQAEIIALLREDWKPPKIIHPAVVRVPPKPAMADAMSKIATRMHSLGNQTLH